MIKVCEKLENHPVHMRDVYAKKLDELMEKDSRVCALDADLALASATQPIYAKYPDRAINCGIAESNMIGVACGLSAEGKVPFAHSFCCFTSRRTCDQLHVSGAYAKLNVRAVGTDPGVTAAFNGGTHMAFEDMGVLRSIPEMTLLEPSDPVMLGDLMDQLVEPYGMFYLRLFRKTATRIYEDGSHFEIGKGVVVREGNDATIIAAGIMVAEAIRAHDILKAEGLNVRVVDMFTWKPIDAELIEKCAAETGAIVTAENHNQVGGLYAAVAEVVVAKKPVPMEAIGTDDRFGQVGTEAFLREEYGLTAEKIAESVRRTIARK